MLSSALSSLLPQQTVFITRGVSLLSLSVKTKTAVSEFPLCFCVYLLNQVFLFFFCSKSQRNVFLFFFFFFPFLVSRTFSLVGKDRESQKSPHLSKVQSFLKRPLTILVHNLSLCLYLFWGLEEGSKMTRRAEFDMGFFVILLQSMFLMSLCEFWFLLFSFFNLGV